jgi:hypothetical protein
MLSSAAGSICIPRPSFLGENDGAAVGRFSWQLQGMKGSIVIAPTQWNIDKQSGLTYSPLEEIMSAIGISLAVSGSALCIGFLAYCICG